MSRGEALEICAGIIAKAVPDLAGLCLALDDADCKRLASALRGRIAGGAAPAIDGEARPDVEFWRAEAKKVVG